MAAGQIYIIRSDDSYATISDPELSEFHGLPCLTGKSVSPNPNNWVNGTVAWVALAHIRSVIVYDSMDQFLAAGKRHEAAKLKKRGWFRK